MWHRYVGFLVWTRVTCLTSDLRWKLKIFWTKIISRKIVVIVFLFFRHIFCKNNEIESWAPTVRCTTTSRVDIKPLPSKTGRLFSWSVAMVTCLVLGTLRHWPWFAFASIARRYHPAVTGTSCYQERGRVPSAMIAISMLPGYPVVAPRQYEGYPTALGCDRGKQSARSVPMSRRPLLRCRTASAVARAWPCVCSEHVEMNRAAIRCRGGRKFATWYEFIAFLFILFSFQFFICYLFLCFLSYFTSVFLDRFWAVYYYTRVHLVDWREFSNKIFLKVPKLIQIHRLFVSF